MKFPEIIFRTVALPISFVVIALGIHFFLRGHNAPGGGFIAGLVVAVAALLVRMARDGKLLRLEPKILIPIGLLIALADGVTPMFVGDAFLRSNHGHLEWLFVGDFEWASAAFFDLGVFLVVIGTTLTIIDLLAEDVSAREIPSASIDEELT